VGPTIHLLLTDVVMPQMGGRALAERLGAVLPGIKTLFISGYTGGAITHPSEVEPRIDLLQKPFSPTALAQKVRAVLNK
jgi:two-component system, cell cycle sensor histidine kinase and response regulator CckA